MKKSKAAVRHMKVDDDYMSKGDAESLMVAHEIMMDPARFKKAHGHIRRKKDAINSIEDIKKAYKKKFSKGVDTEDDMD